MGTVHEFKQSVAIEIESEHWTEEEVYWMLHDHIFRAGNEFIEAHPQWFAKKGLYSKFYLSRSEDNGSE